MKKIKVILPITFVFLIILGCLGNPSSNTSVSKEETLEEDDELPDIYIKNYYKSISNVTNGVVLSAPTWTDEDNLPNDWDRYSVASEEQDKGKKEVPISDSILLSKRIKKRKAEIGDKVIRTSDNLIGKVIDIKRLGSGIEKLILELDDGSLSGVFNSTDLYRVIL